MRGQLPWKAPYLVQSKLDGERCRAVIGLDNTVQLWSSEMNIITGVPHIEAALADLDLPLGLELDGELYQHETEFSSLHSIISRSPENLHPDHQLVEYHVFDIIEETMLQLERAVHLSRLHLTPPIIKVQNHIVETIPEVLDLMINFTDLGYEGIIIRELSAPYVRRRTDRMMKFKPRKSDWYPVIDFKQECDQFGNPKQSLGALVCQGSDGTSFSVGSGLTADQRRLWWLERFDLIGQVAEVKYQSINSSGAPRFPVFVSLLNEVTYDE